MNLWEGNVFPNMSSTSPMGGAATYSFSKLRKSHLHEPRQGAPMTGAILGIAVAYYTTTTIFWVRIVSIRGCAAGTYQITPMLLSLPVIINSGY